MRLYQSIVVSIALGLLLYFFLTPAFLMFAGLAFSAMNGYSIAFTLIGVIGGTIAMALMLPAMLLNQVLPIAASGHSVSAPEASAIAALVWPIFYLAFAIWKNGSRNNAQP
jgi:hypothetical protein